MTSAFGGQHSIQLSYGCFYLVAPALAGPPPYKEKGPGLQSGPRFPFWIGALHPGCDAAMPGAGALALLIGDGGSVLALGRTARLRHLHGRRHGS